MANAMMAAARLAEALDALGYNEDLRQDRVSSLVSGISADVVAFTQVAPQDLRTSAIAAFAATGEDLDELLDAARMLATPVALIEEPTGNFGLYPVGSASERRAEALERFAPAEIPALRGSKLAAELAPTAIRAAKAGMRQLALFPVDALLLVEARNRSVDSVSKRLKESFGLVLGDNTEPTKAARLVIESLAAVIVRDKYQLQDIALRNVVDAALARHGEYFLGLAEWQNINPELVESVLRELGDDIDYSAIDARSINAVYEQLFLKRQLRKDLGIFHTDQRLAARILDHLPVEEIPPEARYVVDPACGAGNLLLAAQERLESLSPGQWSSHDTHMWLKTHIYGADIEAIAVEIAKLSLLISSLPLGNAWQIERRDALADTAGFRVPPTVWVTNPPWKNLKGARDELAVRFLTRAVESLADGGLLACILPAGWLSAAQQRKSRHEITARCNIFEVWRLPRDMFNEARYPAAVVFAQKGQTVPRKYHAFRWLTAGKDNRSEFLDHGIVQFQSSERTVGGDELVGGPADGLVGSGMTVGQVAELRGGVVQSGTPHPAVPREGLPFLVRRAPVAIHRALDAESITWVSDPSTNFLASSDRMSHLLHAPKLLVQADRSPDNPWRLRPVVDSTGVVPSNGWQILSSQAQTIWALNAFFSTSLAACFVQSRAATKRITLDVLRQIPLPFGWNDHYERHFSELGRRMADRAFDLAPLVDEAEALARQAFELTDEPVAAIERIMAGFQAPDGRHRFHGIQAHRSAGEFRTAEFNQAPGTVLSIGRAKIGIWVHGGPDEGYIVDLHEGVPGWLLEEDAMFELTGTPQTGQYRFHRTSYLSSEQDFSLSNDQDLVTRAIDRSERVGNETPGSRDDLGF